MRKILENNKNLQLYFLIISWCKSTSSQGGKRRNSHCKNIMKAEFLYEVNQQKGKRHQNKREILLPCFTVKHTMPRGRWLTNTSVFTSKTSVLLWHLEFGLFKLQGGSAGFTEKNKQKQNNKKTTHQTHRWSKTFAISNKKKLWSSKMSLLPS